MLFDTPLLNVKAEPVADSSAAGQAKKRKRSNSFSTAQGKDQLAQNGAVNLEKLMKTMKKIDGASSGSNKTPIGVRGQGPAPNEPQGKGKGKGKGKAKAKNNDHASRQEDDERPSSPGPARSKKQKQQQKKNDSTPVKPSQSSSLLRPTSPAPSKPFLHSAPNTDASSSQASAAPQTAMQAQLRAKLAGGKFRMLNETLYTTSGQDAWNLMKEEGAFDDVSSRHLWTKVARNLRGIV